MPPRNDDAFCLQAVTTPDPALLATLAAIEASTEAADAGGLRRFAWGQAALAGTLAMPGSAVAVAMAKNGAPPIAFCLYRVVLDELEILQVATERSAQRRGAARALLHWVLEQAKRAAIASCFLEVRESNHPARRLYTALGFTTVGTRRDYYRDPSEDALLLRVELSTAT